MRRLMIAALAACLAAGPAFAQAVPMKYDSAASTNATLVIIGKALLKLIAITNNTAVLYYFKLYDVSAAPTCGTTTPVVFKATIPFGASSSGNKFIVPLAPDGLQFQNGIGFCLTGAIGDSDTTNAATGVTINLGVKQ